MQNRPDDNGSWQDSIAAISVQRQKNHDGRNEKAGNIALCCEGYKQEQNFTGTDMLHLKNFRTVVDALNAITAKEEDGIKAGLKLSLGYLLKKAARFTKCELIIDGKDEEVKERDKFHSLVDGSWGHLFNTAQVQLESNREISLRRPRNLPLESDVQQLCTYILSRRGQMTEDEYLVWTATEFIDHYSSAE